MSQEEQDRPSVGELNLNTLNLTNLEDVTAIIQASNNKRRQISTARENVKRMKTNTYAEEEKILDSQKDVDDINTKIFTSWGQMLMNINSNLSNMEKNINDIKKDQSDIKKDQIDIRNDVKGIKKEQTEMNKKMDGMKKKLDGMEKEQTEMKKEQTEMSKKMDGMEKGFASIKSDVRWLLNKTQYKEGSTFLEMPFTVGEKPDDLPTISSMTDINLLSLEEVKTFLAGYGESTRGNELTLKKRLANLHAVTGVNPSAIITKPND